LNASKGKGSNMKIIQPRLAKRLKRQAWLLSALAVFSFNVLAEEAQAEQDAIVSQPMVSESMVSDSMVSEIVQMPTAENKLPKEQVSLSVEQLKKQVIKLNRDLFILEEDLLFPANTQLVVYLSFATGKFLNLDSMMTK
jgi:hypothetical protein